MELNESIAYLDGSTFYEVIDPELMRQYALSIHASDYSDWEDKYYENEKTHLLKYVESFDKKNKLFRVDYTRKRRIGRVNPKASIGAVSLARATRNTLMRHNYFDFDIENAHPIILREILSRKYNIKTEFPCLDDYCNRRDELLRDIMDAYKIDRKIAKNAFISMMYNGTPESWRKKNSLYFDGYDRKRCLVEELLDNFRTEIDKAITLFINANKEVYKRECDNYRKNKKNVGKKNERGSFLSTVMQEYELQLTSAVMKWCVENGLATFRDMPNCLVASYAYDGFMLLKENVEKYGGIEKLLDDLSQITFDLTGYYNIVWTNKDMNDEFKEFEYSHRDWSAFVKNQDNQNEENQKFINFETGYNIIKEEFEKENFKVIQNSCFIQEVYDEKGDRKLIHRCPSELNVAFSHLVIKYNSYDKKGNIVELKSPFISNWIHCEHIRRYDRMDCFPDARKCPENCFNIWIPFEMEKYAAEPLEETQEVLDGVAFFRNHLSIMCDHEPDTLLEFERWIAQMIQFPDTKSHMPIFQSKEGAGKGSFMQLMQKILGYNKVFLTSSPEEYVWGRFNNLMETAFLVFFDEISKHMTNGGIDKIKNMVTEPEIQIQHKGKGGYTMKSFHRFAGLTNAWDGGITVSKGSRRFLMCQMSNEMLGKTEYWNKFYALLENIDVLRGFYNYYKKMEVPRKLEKPKMTEFALDMAKLSIDVPTLWLKDMLTDAKVNKTLYLHEQRNVYKELECGEYVMELSGSAACKRLLEWCQDNGYHKYETTPIKLGVFLKTKKWSGLKKGKHTEKGETKYYYVDSLLETLEKEME